MKIYWPMIQRNAQSTKLWISKARGLTFWHSLMSAWTSEYGNRICTKKSRCLASQAVRIQEFNYRPNPDPGGFSAASKSADRSRLQLPME